MAVDSIAAQGQAQLTGDVTLSAGSGIVLTQVGQDIEVAASAGTALQRYEALVLSDSPVGYWPLDDASGLPQDISGNGNHMTAVNGTPVYQQTGPFGAGSIEQAIQYPNSAFHERAVISTATDNISVEMWLLRSGSASGNDVFAQGTTSGGFEIEVTTAGGSTRINLPGVGTLGQIGTLPEAWTYVAVVRNAGTWTGYFNLDALVSGSAAPGVPTGNIRIFGGAATSLRVAHLAYYDTALSVADLAARFAIASGTA